MSHEQTFDGAHEFEEHGAHSAYEDEAEAEVISSLDYVGVDQPYDQ